MSRRQIRFEEYASSGPVVERVACNMETKPARAPKFAASASHVANDAYLAAFDADPRKPSSKQPQPASATTSGKDNIVLPKIVGATRAPAPTAEPTTRPSSWPRGPSDAAGSAQAVSSQPLTCMSLAPDGSEAVVGSCDHALYTIPLRSSGSKKARGRTLYTKTCGHKEWVTAVAHLADGRVVSAGMDSKLCLWDNGAVARCEDLTGHAGSISLVQTIGNDWIVSASYDKTYRLWDATPGRRAGKNGRERHVLRGHDAPILDCSLWGSRLVGGDRSGSVLVFDLASYGLEKKWKAAHDGHCTSVLGSVFAHDVAYSGGQDGVVQRWDLRTKASTLALPVHSGKTGKGAVSFLREQPSNQHVLVTGGADGKVHVLDTRLNALRSTFDSHQTFIYSLHVAHDLCFSGSGDGMLLVHDLATDTLCYGLGANQAAVRAIVTTPNELVAAGDDGCVLVYSFE
ncbi:hypothetical protein SPRG_13192 [Saprolegnia parasitica CBS 223.65]|uniref:Uncharacterized protein n=1 Tax=Saprolegnia parasitica (strain CBS 223.65) TaxID=695850 RepID=A0A067BWT5_SAPPC|nr:hypothetical protein SPRG_13192 [Saprolegnia parasitica CBS 223.65]KDO21300.1 hypothetical protein SPRG_13192 [Saprolegnia parasitica CBS 223.65]|eukprot:XP_012207956.1 hypothetical protein SPRG_13192 [Saprolegnia parasitica CBS 223.65]